MVNTRRNRYKKSKIGTVARRTEEEREQVRVEEEDLLQYDEENLHPAQEKRIARAALEKFGNSTSQASGNSTSQAPKGKNNKTKKKRLPKKARLKQKKQSKLADTESDNDDTESSDDELVGNGKLELVKDTEKVHSDGQNDLNSENQRLRDENERLKAALKKAAIYIANPPSESDSESDSAEEVDVKGKPISTDTHKVNRLINETEKSGHTPDGVTTGRKANNQEVSTLLPKLTVDRVKSHKVKKLKDLTDLVAMKDFLHDVKRLNLQDQTLTYLDRNLAEQLSAIGKKTDEQVLKYIEETVQSCDEASDTGTIEHWLQKINFSMDYSKPIEIRLNGLYLQMQVAATKITSFETNESVRRRFLSRVSAKLDPRLTVSPTFLADNPAIATIEDFKVEVEKYKELARHAPKSSEEGKSVEQSEESKTQSELMRRIMEMSKELSEIKKENRQIRALAGRVESGYNSSSESSSSDDSTDEKKPPPPPKLPDKEFEICSATMKKDGYEGYDVKLLTANDKWELIHGVLDSGAQTNCGTYEDFNSYCVDVKVLNNKVELLPWNSKERVRASHVGTLRGLRVYYIDDRGDMKKYTFKNQVRIFFVPKREMTSKLKHDLLIGSKSLKRGNLHPLDSLKRKNDDSRKKKKKDNKRKRSKSRDDDRRRDRDDRRIDDRRSDRDNRRSDRREKDDHRRSRSRR